MKGEIILNVLELIQFKKKVMDFLLHFLQNKSKLNQKIKY